MLASPYRMEKWGPVLLVGTNYSTGWNGDGPLRSTYRQEIPGEEERRAALYAALNDHSLPLLHRGVLGPACEPGPHRVPKIQVTFGHSELRNKAELPLRKQADPDQTFQFDTVRMLIWIQVLVWIIL